MIETFVEKVSQEPYNVIRYVFCSRLNHILLTFPPCDFNPFLNSFSLCAMYSFCKHKLYINSFSMSIGSSVSQLPVTPNVSITTALIFPTIFFLNPSISEKKLDWPGLNWIDGNEVTAQVICGGVFYIWGSGERWQWFEFLGFLCVWGYFLLNIF